MGACRFVGGPCGVRGAWWLDWGRDSLYTSWRYFLTLYGGVIVGYVTIWGQGVWSFNKGGGQGTRVLYVRTYYSGSGKVTLSTFRVMGLFLGTRSSTTFFDFSIVSFLYGLVSRQFVFLGFFWWGVPL